MWNSFITLISHRRSWKNISFDELGELYASLTIKTLAGSMFGVFVPVYLYQNGYTVAEIATFFMIVAAIRTPMARPAARLVAWYGPKHMLSLSYLLLTIVLMLLLTVPTGAIPIWLIALMYGAELELHFTAVDTDFSIIKKRSRGGRELGNIYSFEKLAAALGPLLGGLLAAAYTPQLTLYLSAVLVLTAGVPLLLSPEPMRVRQKLDFDAIDMRREAFNLPALNAMWYNVTVNGLIWPLFAAVYIFEGSVYATLGIVISISTFVSIASAQAIGRLVDRDKGSLLLRYSSQVTAAVQAVRPLINTVPTVLASNIIVEAASNGAHMPIGLGFYQASDKYGDNRPAYFANIRIILNAMRALLWGIVAVLATLLGGKLALQAALLFAALAILLLPVQRFEALKR